MRRILLGLVVVMVAGLALPPAQAGGSGGSCPDPGAFSDERATRVVLSDSCFSPTVTRVDPGDTVTWVNEDKVPHAVGGVSNVFGFMHDQLKPGAELSWTFEKPGVFPYVCVYHPGMAGAVVVGDGVPGKASAAALPAGPGEPAPAAARSSDRPWLVPAALVAGAALLALGALPARRLFTTLHIR